MVLGPRKGSRLARRLGLDALFLLRDGDGEIRSAGVGPLFSKDHEVIGAARERGAA
jgi:thiamine biosynthesis lipoprotein